MMAFRRPFGRPPTASAVALLTLLIAAFGLRVYNLDWDDGRDLHPDELFIAKHVLVGRIHLEWPPDWGSYFDPATSGLNPRSVDPQTNRYRDDYAYGALPVLVTAAASETLATLTGTPWDAPDRAYLVGRAISALLDTATVLLVYLIGARVFSRRVGLLAAAIAALAPMSIQLAHFFTTDSWLTCFVALCLFCGIRAGESGRVAWFAATGAAFGLAMASKGSVFTLAGLVGAAAAYDVWRRWQGGEQQEEAFVAAMKRLAVAGGAAVVAFALFEPYALVKPFVYLHALQRQAEIVRGTLDVPYTRQYIGTTPVLYQIEHLVRWGFGPVSGLLALGGGVVLARRLWRERSAGQWLILAWFFGYGLVIALPETKFLRYLAPLVPVLALMAGVALDALWRWVERRAGRLAAIATTAALLTGVALWTAAFMSIYAHENTRLAASRWIFANVPSGGVLSEEYWDDTLPKDLGSPGLTAPDRLYEHVRLDLYADAPPQEVAETIYAALEQVDYVVLSSNRVSDSIPRSPWRYPVQIRYYELLQRGQLGFELAAEFARPPSIGPLRVDDRRADESFINYDHPRVLIYRKTDFVERPVYDQLMAPAIDRPWSDTRHETRRSLLLDEPVGELPVIADARWSERLTGNSLAAFVVWVGLLGALQVAGWPLASLVFGRFADGGWGAARLVSLLVAGYLVWIGASVRAIEFRAVWAGLALLLVGGVGWAAMRRWRRRQGLWSFRPEQRRVALGAEVTFWLVFAVFFLFRYLNPDGWHPVWGGEKPMEFAHLNATLRSAHFPPYDPWYAGGYINYYYYGLYLVAFCLKLTGIPAEIGFNLAQPTVIALLAAGGYGVAASLGRNLGRRLGAAVPTGAVGALLLVGVGNLYGLRQFARADRAPFGDFGYWTWSASRAIETAITEFPFFTGLYADLHAHVVALPVTVLAIGLGYVIAKDRRLLTLALSPPNGARSGARVLLGARLGLLALTLGTLSATNAWDVPVYAALAAAALLMATAALPGWRRRAATLLALGGALAFATIGLFLPFYQHYVALFGSLARVREPTPLGQIASHLGGPLLVVFAGLVVALLPARPGTSARLGQPLVPLLAVLVLLLGRDVVGELRPDLAVGLGVALVVVVATTVVLAVWERASVTPGRRGRAGLRVGAAVGLLVVALGLATDRVVLGLFLALIGGALALWLTGEGAAIRFGALLAAAAGCIGVGVELVVLADNLIGGPNYRMNTVFKFYNQVWVLLALAAAVLIAKMAIEAGTRLPALALLRLDAGSDLGVARRGQFVAPSTDRSVVESDTVAVEPPRRQWARAGLVATGLVVAASLLYPMFAVGPRLQQRFTDDLGSGTLNALDWMEYGTLPVGGAGAEEVLSFEGDRAAIDWLNRHVDGSPVIAEASIGPYRCNGSRISIGTGLPTIIGWDNHQTQQRYPETLDARVEDVRRLFDSPDPNEKRAILRRYGVAYVVFGDLERQGIRVFGNDCVADPAPEGIAAFRRMLGTDLEVAFSAGGTTVFRVLPVATE